MLEDFSFAENTIGYLIQGDMNKATILELKELVLEKLEVHPKINLYLEDDNIGRFSFSAAAIGAVFPLEHSQRFHKIALVTDRKWIHFLAALDNTLIDASLKHFSSSDRLKAISWIASGAERQVIDYL